MNRNLRNARAIAELLQSQGYDEVLVALGNDGLMTIWRKSPYFSRGMDCPK